MGPLPYYTNVPRLFRFSRFVFLPLNLARPIIVQPSRAVNDPARNFVHRVVRVRCDSYTSIREHASLTLIRLQKAGDETGGGRESSCLSTGRYQEQNLRHSRRGFTRNYESVLHIAANESLSWILLPPPMSARFNPVRTTPHTAELLSGTSKFSGRGRGRGRRGKLA